MFSYFQSKPKPLSNLLIERLIKPLSIASPLKNRIFASSNLEQISILRRQSTVLNVSFHNNEQFYIESDSLTTAEDLSQRLLRQK